MKKNLLIIYSHGFGPMRASLRDHLYSFKHYAKEYRCFYIDIRYLSFPKYLKKIKFDLIVFSWPLLDKRYNRVLFERVIEKISFLKEYSCKKIALPQDEFVNMKDLCNFISYFGVNDIFSVTPESEWKKIYKTINEDVRIHSVLTGYLDDTVIKYVNRKAKTIRKDTHIGYRAVATPIWGEFNLLKSDIANRFNSHNRFDQIKTDIKLGFENLFYGNHWFNFLLRCKYIPGVEGGCRILDWDGSRMESISSFLSKTPDATYDDILRVVDKTNREGEIEVKAISPRHLEACLTKTCQVLIEGKYNGILKPWTHYIPLKENFSNFEEVIDIILEDKLREDIVNKAYEDIVISGSYTYRSFVEKVLGAIESSEQNNMNSFFIVSFGIFVCSITEGILKFIRLNVVFQRFFNLLKNINGK